VHQLWLFWLAPLIGGALGGVIYNTLFGTPPPMPEEKAFTRDRPA
jgi:aquaporin Z